MIQNVKSILTNIPPTAPHFTTEPLSALCSYAGLTTYISPYDTAVSRNTTAQSSAPVYRSSGAVTTGCLMFFRSNSAVNIVVLFLQLKLRHDKLHTVFVLSFLYPHSG
jgi:hypothetical protein